MVTQTRQATPIRRREARRTKPPTSRKRAALICVTIVIILLLVPSGLIWTRLAAFNDRTSTQPALSSSLVGPLVFGTGTVNILILGYGGSQHDGPYLTDSMNVMVIEPDRGTTLIPIPRDLWIEGMEHIPGNGKINLAFAIGHEEGGAVTGADRASEVVSDVTGLVIDHWIAIDFAGFSSAVQALGGVTVANPSEFSYGSPDAAAAGSGWDGNFAAGSLHLSGEQALLYARTRFTSDPQQSTDFARSVRQQRILEAITREVTNAGLAGIGRGLTVMDAVDEHLDTNLSVIDLGLLAQRTTPDRRIELSEGVALEATMTTDGQYVLVPVGRRSTTDYMPIRRYLGQQLERDAASGLHPTP